MHYERETSFPVASAASPPPLPSDQISQTMLHYTASNGQLHVCQYVLDHSLIKGGCC